jgi:hypothetical protein
MKENGSHVLDMETVPTSSQMVTCISVNTKMAVHQVLASINGLMETPSLVSFTKDRSMDRVSGRRRPRILN